MMPAREIKLAPACACSEPSLWEALLMFAMVYAVHLLTVCRVKNLWDLAAAWYDNPSYLKIAAIIRSGHSSAGWPWHFWGFPYAIAGISKLFAIQGVTALVLISALSSLAVCILVHRLYGGWVAAAALGFINYRWIYSSVEGGSEPLFMCLLFASFLAARSGRWNTAALLASLSTTVRPVGIFALVGFAVVLGMRKSYRQLATITLIGLGIGVLYVVPLWVLVGNPFANFIGYRDLGGWGPHGSPLTYPFGAVIPCYLAAHDKRWPVVVFSIAWLALALVGTVAMWLPRNPKSFSATWRPEALFASMFTLFFVSYNEVGEVAWDLPRFLMPALPMLLFSLRNWIPQDRRVLWAAAGLSPLLASAAVVSFTNVFGFKLP